MDSDQNTGRLVLAVLALALAGSQSVATAQVVSSEVYGEFRYSYNYADHGSFSRWASANNASRLGVRGEVSEGGLAAFVDLQTGVNVDAEGTGGAFTQRYYLAGIRGAFGTVSVGRQSIAYKIAGQRMDPFYDSSALSARGNVPQSGLFAGASFGLSNLTNGWADRTVAYTSPSFAGVTLNAAAFIDTDSNHDFGLGVGYLGHGFDAGLQYYNADGGRLWSPAPDIDQATRLHVAYARGTIWMVGASFEHIEAVSDVVQNYLYAVATVSPTPRIMIAGAVGFVEDGRAVQPVSGTGFHVGAFYSLFRQVRLHGLYSRVDVDDGPGVGNVALGLTYQFSVKP